MAFDPFSGSGSTIVGLKTSIAFRNSERLGDLMDAPGKKVEPPFQWGDRVDHRVFGLGTVKGQPSASIGPSKDWRDQEHKGWAVPVKWDDPARDDNVVMSTHLRMVERPNAKGSAFWNHEFQKLKMRVLTARQATDLAIGTAFRPQQGGGAARVQAALAHEKESLDELAAFLNHDERGEHV